MKMPRIDTIALILLIVGGLNAGVATVFDFNVVGEVLGSGSLSDALSVLTGLSALYMLAGHMGIISSDDA